MKKKEMKGNPTTPTANLLLSFLLYCVIDDLKSIHNYCIVLDNYDSIDASRKIFAHELRE